MAYKMAIVAVASRLRMLRYSVCVGFIKNASTSRFNENIVQVAAEKINVEQLQIQSTTHQQA
jgi:hypothetical protein